MKPLQPIIRFFVFLFFRISPCDGEVGKKKTCYLFNQAKEAKTALVWVVGLKKSEEKNGLSGVQTNSDSTGGKNPEDSVLLCPHSLTELLILSVQLLTGF